MGLKIIVHKTHPWRSFGSALSSDSTALSSNTFEVSNIHNCNIIEVYYLNAFCFFVTFI